ncbi:MAG: bifunctional DNA-binding transcriptional regulator/O6-methylguanine-DNA methyltransferase Ada [Pseudomonadota bacterium]
MTTTTAKRAATTLADPRWASVLARDPDADDTFVYAVRTTGVYCRPSCASRHARPENVEFFATPFAARQAGFRPCTRCRPDEPSRTEQQTALIADLCRYIEEAPQAPTLDELAERAGISAYHLHRVFKNVTGVTPRAYAAAHRGQRVRAGLAIAETVTDAIYDAGYNSNGHFYAEADRLLGMTPGEFRAGGANAEIRFAVGQCSLGAILVAESARGICAIQLGDDPEALVRALQDRFPAAVLVGDDDAFAQRVATVVGFVETPRRGLDLPLDIRGTAFQQRVWQALRDIPAGQTASYTEIANRIGAPKSVRAVAGACAANLLAVAIPCHRVVRSDGGISGYRWGVERKRALLDREAAS